MNKRSKMIAAGTVAALGLGTFGAAGVHAATSTTGQSLAAAIASKFGLKQADVQAVIDTKHDETRAQHQQNYEAKLDAAVAAGTITADQKTKIIAKTSEVEAAREANRKSMADMTPAERKTARDAERTALQKWASDNKIPQDLLALGFGGRGHGGMGHGMRSDAAPDGNGTN